MDADWSRLSDDELLRRALREPDAFAAFYSRHERLTLAFFVGRVGDAEVAADLAQCGSERRPDSACRPKRSSRAEAALWGCGVL